MSMKTTNKSLTILNFTDESVYGCPQKTSFGLGFIDKKEKKCRNRTSNDKNLSAKYGYMRSCLEEIGNVFSRPEDKSIIFYNVKEDKTENIRSFISYIETKLKLDKKSEIFETNNSYITAIRVAPFWLSCPMRRRLYLILIRESQQYDSSLSLVAGLNDLCEKSGYIGYLKNLLNLFLSGYVFFTPKSLDILKKDFHKGIITQFSNKTKPEILDSGLISKEDENNN